MRSFGRTGRSVLVGLTAIATLLAGSPHVDCLCPNGHVKLFCLGLVAPASDCCSASAGDRPTSPARPCCKHAPTPGPAIKASGCAKTVSPAKPFLSVKDRGPGDAGGPAPLAVAAVPASHVPAPGQFPSRRPSHSLPPPPDLIVLLGHFTI